MSENHEHNQSSALPNTSGSDDTENSVEARLRRLERQLEEERNQRQRENRRRDEEERKLRDEVAQLEKDVQNLTANAGKDNMCSLLSKTL